MAAGAFVHRLDVDLSLVERGVYQTLALRLARHPSESMRYFVARAVGFGLVWEPGLEMGRGLSTVEEPAAWLRETTGTIRLWMEVGSPSAARLHRAAKAASRVVVFTYSAAGQIERELSGERIHRAGEIEIYRLDTAFLDALAERWERTARWELVHSGDCVYVGTGGQTFESVVERVALPP